MFFPVKNTRIQLCFTFFLIFTAMMSNRAFGQTGIQWEKDLEKANARAISEQKPLLLHFYGDFCAPCQMMERDVFPNTSVIEKLNADFVAIKINVSQSPQLMSRYGVRGWPMDIFLSPTGERLHERVGMTSVPQFLGELTSIAVKFPKPQPVQQAQTFQTVQSLQSGGITLAEYSQPGVPQLFSHVQPTDFSDLSVLQVSPYLQPSQHISSDSEGYAVSGNSNVNQENANVTAQLHQLQAALGSIPNHQVVQPSQPQQFMPPQVAEEQHFAVAQPIQPTVSQQMVLQQIVEPQPAQSILNQSSLFAAAPPASPMVPSGSYENGIVRKQPTPGLGAGNSLGVVAATSEKPTAIQMPTIALDGFCPVSLAQTAKWVKGNAEIMTEYDGVLFRLASVEARNVFANNPSLYAPVLRGNDVVELLTNRREVTGQRKFGAWYQGQVFLFTSAENYEKFQYNPELYAFQTQQSTNALAVSLNPIN